jgi:hypothetical protein
VVRSVFRGVVEDIGEEDANSDSPLVETDDGATNPLGGALGLVHWDQSGDQTNANASKNTADDEEREGGRGCLEGDSNREDATRSNKAPFATKNVTEGSSRKSA